ncbi:MAG: ABC transporter substrate-binding protein [Desulfobacteraceae bacterium]|nr:ABC transporter substrate-binding protein [Desulfobacteraceae bacterium]
MRKCTVAVLFFLFLASFTTVCSAGETVVVGFQPFDTISYQVAVNQELGLWKKYFPKDVTVEFQPALQGSIIANNMLAGKQQIGYMSIMPATLASTKPDQANIRMVASLGMSDGMRCSLLLVKKDAPQFKNQEEAIKWLNDKIVAAPKGSAADQYLRMVFAKYNVKPKEYLNQSIEVIGSNFRIGKLDAAAMWEPTISRVTDLVGEGIARIAATGTSVNNPDLGILLMRGDFVDKRPDLAEAWIRAELDAQIYMSDPKNWAEVTKMIAKNATGIPEKVLWYSIYGKIPENVGGTKEREWKPFIFDEKVQKNIADVYAFLLSEKAIKYDKPLPKTVDDSIARKVLKEKNLTSPVAVIIGEPPEKCPFK